MLVASPNHAIIISSDESVIRSVTEVLSGYGLASVAVNDLTKAHDSYENVSLLIVDYDTPQMDRFPWPAHARNAAVVGLCSDPALIDSILDRGAQDVLLKPVSSRLLQVRLRAVVENPQNSSTQAAYRVVRHFADFLYSLTLYPDGRATRDWGDESGFVKLTGRTFAEFDAGGGWRTVVVPEDIAIVAAHAQDVVSGQPLISDFRVIHKDGTVRWLRDYNYPQHQNNGTLRIYGAMQDITREKEAEQVRIENQRMLDSLHNTSLMLSGTLDFEAVLDRILINVAQVIPYDLADVMLIEDGVARAARHRGYAEHNLTSTIETLAFTISSSGTQHTLRSERLSRIAQTGQILSIADIWTTDKWTPVQELAWVRSYMGAPLYVGERLAGFLNVNSGVPNLYTREHAHRMQVFASQVSVAISNAQLYATASSHAAELEARIRDLVVVYTVGQALTSTLKIEEIYALLYERVIQQILHAPRMNIFSYDAETQSVRCIYSCAEEEITMDMLSTPFRLGSDYVSMTIRTQLPQMHEREIFEPLISRGKVTGVLHIQHHESGRFDEVQLTLFSTIVSQVAVALENAHLYATIEKQVSELAILHDATHTLLIPETMPELMRAITHTVVHSFRYVDCGLLLLEDGYLKEMSRSGEIQPKEPKALPVYGTSLAAEAVRTRETLASGDVRADPRAHPVNAAVRSQLVVPLQTHKGVLGVLDLQSRRAGAFLERDRRIIKAFADRAAAVLENMLLMDEIRLANAELEQRVAERTAELQFALTKERELSEMKSRFVSTVSHEFRTPLTKILSANELLERYFERMTQEQRQTRFEMVRTAVQEMVQLLEDTMSISDVTQGIVEVRLGPVDLVQYTGEVINDIAHTLVKDRYVSFNAAVPALDTLVDKVLWRKLIKELMVNAVKYSADGGHIRCTLLATSARITLSVEDDGIGIPAEDRPYIFDMFRRGTNVSGIPGTGLGLSVVKRVVELHNGTIEVQSGDNGTIILVHVPYRSQERTTATDESGRTSEDPGH